MTQTLSPLLSGYDADGAVRYHYGAFPPDHINFAHLMALAMEASAALARYDQMVQSLANPSLLIAPLSRREAVASSRMEGTVSTLDALLELESEQGDGEEHPSEFRRSETFEVLLYTRAMQKAEIALQAGYPISETLIREMHQTLLSFGRGASKRPGEYKTEQNYLADTRQRKIQFIPISPSDLRPAMRNMIAFMGDTKIPSLFRVAIGHVEFEALHPFDDGNGRVGRMLITLYLSQLGLIGAPYFYISGYFDDHKDEYIEAMRAVSRDKDWTRWCQFFFEAVKGQSESSLSVANAISSHYEILKPQVSECLGSKWSVKVLDHIFAYPIFTAPQLSKGAGLTQSSANRFVRHLHDAGIIDILRLGAGRRPTRYRLTSLLDIVRN